MPPKAKPPSTATAQTIGLRIKEQRESLSISQSDLGGAIGVSYQMIWKYENGKGRLSAEHLAKIAVFLKTDVEFFYM